MRISSGPSLTETRARRLRDIVLARPPGGVPPPACERWCRSRRRCASTSPRNGEGDVDRSDRCSSSPRLLRPFHELQLAQAVYAELLRPTLAAARAGDGLPLGERGRVARSWPTAIMTRPRRAAQRLRLDRALQHLRHRRPLRDHAEDPVRRRLLRARQGGRPAARRDGDLQPTTPPGPVVLEQAARAGRRGGVRRAARPLPAAPGPLRPARPAVGATRRGAPARRVDRAVSGDRLPGRDDRLQRAEDDQFAAP